MPRTSTRPGARKPGPAPMAPDDPAKIVSVTFGLPRGMIDRIDRACGGRDRSAWLRAILARALD